MLRRHPSTAFGSVHVFPGGVVDAADHDAALDARCPGLDDADGSARLGVPSGRPGLLGGGGARGVRGGRRAPRPHRGRRAPCASTTTPTSRLGSTRTGARSTPASARSSTCSPPRTSASPLDDVHYFAHWITPEGEPKRFDTRFFLARAPEGQAYAHDDGELIGSEWVRPADALRRHRAGDFAMIGPTIVSLQDIGRFATCDELFVVATRPRHGRRRSGDPVTDPTTPRSRGPKPIVPGVASALSPLVRRIVANNPGPMTGPGHQHLPRRHRRDRRDRSRARRSRRTSTPSRAAAATASAGSPAPTRTSTTSPASPA